MTRTPTASTGHRARPGSRREDIAAAAIELFLDRGVAATRVEDILAAAGVIRPGPVVLKRSRRAPSAAVRSPSVGGGGLDEPASRWRSVPGCR